MTDQKFHDRIFSLTSPLRDPSRKYTLTNCDNFTSIVLGARGISLDAEGCRDVYFRVRSGAARSVHLVDSTGHLEFACKAKCKTLSVVQSDVSIYSSTTYMEKMSFEGGRVSARFTKTRSQVVSFTDGAKLDVKVRISEFDELTIGDCTGKISLYHATVRKVSIKPTTEAFFVKCRFHQTKEEVLEACPATMFSKCEFSYVRK